MADQLSSAKLLHNIIVILTGCSIWYPDNISNFKKKWYKVNVIFMRFIIYPLYILPQIIQAYMVVGDLELFAEVTFVLITVILETVKASAIFRKQNKIKKFMKYIDEDSLNPRTTEERNIVSSAYKRNNVLFWIIVVMYNTTVLLWAVFLLMDTSEHGLLTAAWYPFAYDSTPTYEIVFSFQCISNSLLATLDAALDLTSVSLLTLVSVKVDILLHRIYGGFSGFKKYHDKGENVEQLKKQFLKECAMQHELVIQYSRIVSNILKPIIIGQFTIGCLIMCMTMFQASVVEPFSMLFITTFVYQTCMISQLFMYSWYGNEITLKCSQIPYAAYCSDWYEQESQYCRTLKFIMMKANTPVNISGGYFFSLSLNLFTGILRTSWSYFAFLNQVHYED